MRGGRARLILALLGSFLASACATVAPPDVPIAPSEASKGPMIFDHDDFDSFLRRFVDDAGRVDYEAAAADRRDFDRYLATLAARSPDSHPEQFPDDDHVLAYWINAYNASAIALVLREAPIGSVRDVRPLGPFSFLLPKGAGFFFLRRVVLGGVSTTLYGLENVVVRKRFDEPRIHFALNCASVGCPRLPAGAFHGQSLEAELSRETTRFLLEARNLRVDVEGGTVWLSSIFDWFRKDFEGWMARHRPDAEASLLGWVREFAEPGVIAALDRCGDCRVRFVEYDWALNAAPAP